MVSLLNKSFSDDEIDFDYEYDAANYYDFTTPETDSEAHEAERWFETAAYHPPTRKPWPAAVVFLFNVLFMLK